MKCSIDYSRLRKGGETMRLVCLMVLASFLLAGSVFAYSEVIYPAPNGTTGANWIALRGVPFDPDPIAIFGDVDLIDGMIARLDPTSGGTEDYWSFQEPGGPFGGMLLGDGYWLNSTSQYTINYDGAPDGLPDGAGQKTDMWISLPGVTGREGGFHWIGHPFNHEVPFVNVMVTDGTQTISVLDAIEAGWLDGYWAYLDAPSQGTLNVDPEELMGSPNLEPGRMYQVFTRKANLALIIPPAQ